MNVIVNSLNDLTSRLATAPTTPADADALDERSQEKEDERSQAKEDERSLPQNLILESEADVEVVEPIIIPHSKDAIISHEAEAVAEAENDDDAVIATVEDVDLPISSIANVGDEEDEEEDDEAYDSLSLPDTGQDLGDDDDDDDGDDDYDDFTIQYHTRPVPAKKRVSLMESSSQGEKEKS
ncbi:uncharacterized protein LOC112514088 [Cynara cardunculus var. scolymus]|uniref:uncharacterized protein LOC112514088 n=1 Tax=Cynara cardunculus var. scolymus TaxID=59895 RepID=UPI000D62504D|nr:uncharacterized protein LOC112514088 [Cynara cardunculus var. scolymus]